ncbi:MAG TPA: alpha/beta hydrolase [Pseudonocardiaceae bacterium]|jgi:dienelactone hydrolase
MRFISETTVDGVSERLFILDDIPGVLWSPADATGSRPLVLMGHGGGQHKQAPGMVGRARRFVTECGYAVAAVDAPGHGDRPKTDQDEQLIATVRERVDAGEPIGPLMTRYNVELAKRVVPEWQHVLDALRQLDCDGPVGYLGMSMGGGLGVSFVAAEPRVTAAVLGLVGGAALAEVAARITVPIEFVLQWDDEMVARAAGLALFDAFASNEKTLHANPGGHGDTPRFEVESAQRFFARYLG